MNKILLALSLVILLSACDGVEKNESELNTVDFSAYSSLADLYNGEIKTVVEMKCSVCHGKSLKADNTDLLFVKEDDAGNIVALKNLINKKSGDRLVSKAIGRRHGGGTQIVSGSTEAQALAEFASRVATNAQ